MQYELCVLGGGAAGILAAISAARENISVVLLETNDSIGKKLLATGNGKCNFTNEIINENCYYTTDYSFIESAFHQFSRDDLLAFFDEIGLFYTTKNGYYYPNSRQAKSVVDALEAQLKISGVTTYCNFKVQKIIKDESGFFIQSSEQKTIRSKCVIMALGGMSSQIKGSNGDGYYLAEQFGHHIRPLSPALVALESDDSCIQLLTGARAIVEVTLFIDGFFLRQEFGEIQFTDYGVSGIVIFQLSRLVSQCENEFYEKKIFIDFLPSLEKESFYYHLLTLLENTKGETFFTKICTLLPEQVLHAIFLRLHLSESTLCDEISENVLLQFVSCVKGFEIFITKSHGYKMAQTTAGGIDTEELTGNLESKFVPGLYFAGEIVDVDGICGGYNLQWAFSSGVVAARAAARELNDRNQ